LTLQKAAESAEFETGYLAGLVDGDGYIFVHCEKKGNRTYPDLRIYCTSKSIIEGACRILGVNPYSRRNHTKLVGRIAAVQGKKAMVAIRKIRPYLTDTSKKCRASTILKVFNTKASVGGRHPLRRFFQIAHPQRGCEFSKSNRQGIRLHSEAQRRTS